MPTDNGSAGGRCKRNTLLRGVTAIGSPRRTTSIKYTSPSQSRETTTPLKAATFKEQPPDIPMICTAEVSAHAWFTLTQMRGASQFARTHPRRRSTERPTPTTTWAYRLAALLAKNTLHLPLMANGLTVAPGLSPPHSSNGYKTQKAPNPVRVRGQSVRICGAYFRFRA